MPLHLDADPESKVFLIERTLMPAMTKDVPKPPETIRGINNKGRPSYPNFASWIDTY